MEDISKGEPVIITRKLRSGGGSIVLSIPKDIAELMSLDTKTVVEVTIRKVMRVVRLEKETIRQ